MQPRTTEFQTEQHSWEQHGVTACMLSQQWHFRQVFVFVDEINTDHTPRRQLVCHTDLYATLPVINSREYQQNLTHTHTHTHTHKDRCHTCNKFFASRTPLHRHSVNSEAKHSTTYTCFHCPTPLLHARRFCFLDLSKLSLWKKADPQKTYASTSFKYFWQIPALKYARTRRRRGSTCYRR